jgi:protein-lysine N-methyltransferase EEF2KMT
LAVPYTHSMLYRVGNIHTSISIYRMHWKSGPHECDGPWAPWWYHDIHQTTGWCNNNNIKNDQSTDTTTTTTPNNRRYRTLHPSYMSTLRASYPAYQFLSTLTHRSTTRGPAPEIMYPDDLRNQHVLVYIGATPGYGQIVPRDMAGVNPFDSIVQGGDATWEGLRVYRGKILCYQQHLNRLYKSARALGFPMDRIHSRAQITDALFAVLAANGMRDHVHIRLSLSRGEKCTSSMNPKFNVYGTTLILLPEWKPVHGQTTYDNAAGISLLTASQRRNAPSTLDSKIHHNNLLNNILPKIQANYAGCADALMLDVDGYVSETNATNIFMVDESGTIYTPPADSCLPGITRQAVMELAQELAIPMVSMRRLSLAEFHSAAEVFTTGTMGELTPVIEIDGRTIGDGICGPITKRLQEVYQTLPDREGWSTPLPPFE